MQDIVARLAGEEVVATPGGQDIVTLAAVQAHGIAVGLKHVVAGLPLPVDQAEAADHHVVAGAALGELAAALEPVVARAEQDVAAAEHHPVVAVAGVDAARRPHAIDLML